MFERLHMSPANVINHQVVPLHVTEQLPVSSLCHMYGLVPSGDGWHYQSSTDGLMKTDHLSFSFLVLSVVQARVWYDELYVYPIVYM